MGARERTLPVLGPLRDLFPGGALQRGWVIATGGDGATSLAFAVAAGPSAAGSWVAVVGEEGLGLAAAAEAGMVLERLLVAAASESRAAAEAVAALVGAVDIVLLGSGIRLGAADHRRPVVALGYPLTDPVAVAAASRVVAASSTARSHGVVPGLRLRTAAARCVDLVVYERDLATEARAFEPVVAALDAVTPEVEVSAPGMCAFATRSPSRYFGGGGHRRPGPLAVRWLARRFRRLPVEQRDRPAGAHP